MPLSHGLSHLATVKPLAKPKARAETMLRCNNYRKRNESSNDTDKSVSMDYSTCTTFSGAKCAG